MRRFEEYALEYFAEKRKIRHLGNRFGYPYGRTRYFLAVSAKGNVPNLRALAYRRGDRFAHMAFRLYLAAYALFGKQAYRV